MNEIYVQDRHFERIVDEQRFWKEQGSSFENCIFSACNFRQADMSGLRFFDCRFDNCDLSLADLKATIFQNVAFHGCRLSGVLFDNCNPFGLALKFYDSQLNHSSFYDLKVSKAVFAQCSLKGVDFSSAQLREAKFNGSDLTDAKFDRTNLEKADFSTASHYTINPELNKIGGALFSIEGLPGLLEAYKIKIVP